MLIKEERKMIRQSKPTSGTDGQDLSGKQEGIHPPIADPMEDKEENKHLASRFADRKRLVL